MVPEGMATPENRGPADGVPSATLGSPHAGSRAAVTGSMGSVGAKPGVEINNTEDADCTLIKCGQHLYPFADALAHRLNTSGPEMTERTFFVLE